MYKPIDLTALVIVLDNVPEDRLGFIVICIIALLAANRVFAIPRG